MPFGVTKWPKQPDPRAPDYIIQGWAVGQLSPWQWILATSGATEQLAVFNDGVLCVNTFNSPTFGGFQPVVPLDGELNIVFTIVGSQIPFGGGSPYSIEIEIWLFWFSTLLYRGNVRQLFPTALQIHGPINMLEFVTTFGTVTEPMTVEPAKWNV